MPKRNTYKQPVLASQGVVSANHPLASAAGATMLAYGGTVADAAVATIATLTVVEPMMVGPLGGGYIMSRNAAGEVMVIDNYATAPGRATPDMYEPDDATGPMEAMGLKNRVGYLACGVPGNLKGWFRLHKEHGRLPIEQVLAPAIHYAESGFPASAYLQKQVQVMEQHLAKFPESAAVFLKRGGPPEVGDLIINKDLAATLRVFAAEGPDALYGGHIGQALVDAMERNGGLVTMDDLRAYDVRVREPIRGTYRGYEILGTPPSSGGGLLNQLGFNIMEQFDVGSLGPHSAKYYHLVIETLKLMFADRAKYLGDPEQVPFPLEALIDKAYGKVRAGEISMSTAQSFQAGMPVLNDGDSGHTTHLTVMAADGSVVTMTQTINDIFGGKAIVPGTGLFINDTMALFDPHPGRPNSIAPGKRMLTATAATIVMKDGEPVFALGTPGATRIFPAVFQGILNVIDHGMDLQESVEAPRVWSDGRTTEVEGDIPESVRSELEAMGHKLAVVDTVAGGMNGVQVDPDTGLLLGAACWRADGSPVGISGGPARRMSTW
jgi:gamma-glutamyltranspeptidase/glutathione hydrolase